MSLDVGIALSNWQIILVGVLAYKIVKGVGIYAVARLLRADHAEALERAVLMAQGGEFAFVLYSTAVAAGIIPGEQNAILTATVIASMVLTPFTVLGLRYVLPKPEQSMEGVEVADGLTGNVLIIGFGRFGQIASQVLLSRGIKISIIDNDTEMIRAAGQFGFKIYYGDGTRLDILRAAGAPNADAVLIATDRREQTTRIAELIRHEFPLVKVLVRSFDRAHSIELVKIGVDYQLREVFESALTFGAETIRQLGASEDEIADIVESVRTRDQQRFDAQVLGGLQAGRDLLISNAEEQARESGVVTGPSTPIIAPPEEEGAKV